MNILYDTGVKGQGQSSAKGGKGNKVKQVLATAIAFLGFSEEDTKECTNKSSRVDCGAPSSAALHANLLLHSGRHSKQQTCYAATPVDTEAQELCFSQILSLLSKLAFEGAQVS